MDAVGQVLNVGHIGYGEDNTGELLVFYEKILGLDHVSAYGIDHPYVGRINGVTDCLYDIGFAKCSKDEHKLELVGCVNAVKGDARFAPGLCGHAHMIFTTDDIEACYERLAEKAVSFSSDIITIDYGRFSGRRSFNIFDINQVHIMIVEKENGTGDGNGFLESLAGVSYTVSDLATCKRWFERGLLLRTQQVDISGSQYLNNLCGEKDYPPDCVEVNFPGEEKFVVELLQAARDNEKTRSVWVNSQGCLHLCAIVDDIYSVYDRMEKEGAVFVGEPALVELGPCKGARAIFTKMPNEILLELYQAK